MIQINLNYTNLVEYKFESVIFSFKKIIFVAENMLVVSFSFS